VTLNEQAALCVSSFSLLLIDLRDDITQMVTNRMSSDYELSDDDYYSDEEMIDGTQDDQGELSNPLNASASCIYVWR
jgi:hypothetical protein